MQHAAERLGEKGFAFCGCWRGCVQGSSLHHMADAQERSWDPGRWSRGHSWKALGSPEAGSSARG